MVNRLCKTSNKERSRVVKRMHKKNLKPRAHLIKDEAEKRVKRKTVYRDVGIQYMCNSLNCLLVFLGVKEGIDELLQQPAWCPQEGKYAPLRGNGRAGPSQSVISHVLYSFF